jgi:hypothetical protein
LISLPHFWSTVRRKRSRFEHMQTVNRTSRRIRGLFAWSGSELWSCFKYSRSNIKNLKHIAVDVLSKGFPVIPLSDIKKIYKVTKGSLKIVLAWIWWPGSWWWCSYRILCPSKGWRHYRFNHNYLLFEKVMIVVHILRMNRLCFLYVLQKETKMTSEVQKKNNAGQLRCSCTYNINKSHLLNKRIFLCILKQIMQVIWIPQILFFRIAIYQNTRLL